MNENFIIPLLFEKENYELHVAYIETEGESYFVVSYMIQKSENNIQQIFLEWDYTNNNFLASFWKLRKAIPVSDCISNEFIEEIGESIEKYYEENYSL